MLLRHLQSKYDYSKDGKYLIIQLWKRRNDYEEIAIDWFDYSPGSAFEWLIIREYKKDSNGKKKYRKCKLNNIQEQVKVQAEIFEGKDGAICV